MELNPILEIVNETPPPPAPAQVERITPQKRQCCYVFTRGSNIGQRCTINKVIYKVGEGYFCSKHPTGWAKGYDPTPLLEQIRHEVPKSLPMSTSTTVEKASNDSMSLDEKIDLDLASAGNDEDDINAQLEQLELEEKKSKLKKQKAKVEVEGLEEEDNTEEEFGPTEEELKEDDYKYETQLKGVMYFGNMAMRGLEIYGPHFGLPEAPGFADKFSKDPDAQEALRDTIEEQFPEVVQSFTPTMRLLAFIGKTYLECASIHAEKLKQAPIDPSIVEQCKDL
jgi:hypothetical protein